MLNNALGRVIPEELFFTDLLVETELKGDNQRCTQEEEVEYALKATGLEHFELVKFLGKGGFSQVLEVKLKQTNKLYGLKTIRKDLIQNEKDYK